jgi:hypothetical protein
MYAGRDHDAVEGFLAVAAGDPHPALDARDTTHFHAEAKVRAPADAGARQPHGELVDIARGVALGQEAADEIAVQRRFHGPYLVGREFPPLQSALGQQAIDHAPMPQVLLMVVEMQDAAPLEIEVDPLARRHLEQNRPRGDRQTYGFHGVRLVTRDVRQELGHPADLVQRGARVHQQRRIGLQHPLQPLQHRAPLGPDLGIRGRELAAVGEAGFHRGIAVAVENRHLEPAVEQFIGSRQAGHAGADHGNRGHGSHSRVGAATAAMPPPCLGPESFTRSGRAFSFGGLLRSRFPEC